MRPFLILAGLTVVVTTAGPPGAGADREPAATARITNGGRTIQVAQGGAYVNVPVVADGKDDRLVTRVESRALADGFGVAVVAEFRHGDRDKYSYALFMIRAPRCAYPVRRDFKAAEVTAAGPRFGRVTLDNPESDTVNVRLEEPAVPTAKPVSYTNGCLRAWLYF
jgi:hypothetical protein